MEGFATMFLRVPTCFMTLPLQGKCRVEGKKARLQFPVTRIEFELPSEPTLAGGDCAFKIMAPRGNLMVTLHYVQDTQCYVGVGRQEQDRAMVLKFYFWKKDSKMGTLGLV